MSHYQGAVPETKHKPDWRDDAACRDKDPERWFPNPGNTLAVQEAKTVCFSCPAMLQCAQKALTTNEEAGVWGGLSEGQRTTIRKKYRVHQLQNPDLVETAVYAVLNAGLNPTETLSDLWEKYTQALPGGHIGWSGPAGSFSFHGLPITANQLAFRIDRGHKAVGNVRRTCKVVECVNPRHLADNEERRQRAAADLEMVGPAEPTELAPCGTRPAYKRHLRNGEPADEACMEANRIASEASRTARSAAA
jgi:hypothetical protein